MTDLINPREHGNIYAAPYQQDNLYAIHVQADLVQDPKQDHAVQARLNSHDALLRSLAVKLSGLES